MFKKQVKLIFKVYFNVNIYINLKYTADIEKVKEFHNTILQ